jgi:hypothetical protein
LGVVPDGQTPFQAVWRVRAGPRGRQASLRARRTEPVGNFATPLNDREFWKLIGELSEADGSFRSDNLL